MQVVTCHNVIIIVTSISHLNMAIKKDDLKSYNCCSFSLSWHGTQRCSLSRLRFRVRFRPHLLKHLSCRSLLNRKENLKSVNIDIPPSCYSYLVLIVASILALVLRQRRRWEPFSAATGTYKSPPHAAP